MSAAGENACDLCGLPAGRNPLTRRFAEEERAFCCLGCMNVYAILLESGVLARGGDFRDSEVYRQSLKLGLISNRASRRVEVPAGAETREITFHLSGLWCASCGWLIEHALGAEPGIVSVSVLFASDLLRVNYCPQFVPPGRIEARVASLGYRAAEQAGQTDRDRGEKRDLLLRTGIAAFLWMNVMTLSLVIYASYWEAISDAARRIVPLVLAALTLPAVFYCGWPVLRVAYLGARARALRVEALLALGILAAFGYSAAQAFTGGRHFYFDTACAIVTLVLLGKLLEREAKERTTRSIALLYRMMPNKARLLAGGRERFVAVDALDPGSLFVVKAGERIPADGVVVTGESHVDESLLSGESTPHAKRPGDGVAGGSLNIGGVLEIRATRAAGESALSQIIRSVESAMSNRAPIERTVDRVSRRFVPAIALVAAFTFAGWLAGGAQVADALMRAIAVLVIACPCALGIATPLAVTVAVGAAARRGILIRDSRVLEEVEKLDVVVFDKTGTVTHGEFSVTGVELDTESLASASAVEQFSEHPLGRALARHAASLGLALPPASGIAVHRGLGIAGAVNGRPVWVGNRAFLAGACSEIPAGLEEGARLWESRGFTVAFAGGPAGVAGAVAFGDTVRGDARELFAVLDARHVRTVLLSGDAPATTAWVAAEIGAGEFRAGILPDGKRAFIEELKAAGATVAMVGDGGNDAPALAAANLGIALGSGADLAMQAAPVVLLTPALGRVTSVFEISRLTLRTVRQNLFWAFFYNAGGIGLAVAGVLSPILAAGAMVLSSLSVIGNSLRLTSRIGRV